ncbi:hypothetical protein [Deinococcus sp. RM]|uniref:hypothetical protein n=1 Tax=Deinococcus sp. RM TaxID=2316359 RepID=UPI000E67FB0B|nr:hypothetical protein [Deinococcus sp. RM]RIY15684.1 hypothetical protein D3W47_01265 [Deinococcus sp. RM]
MPLRLTLLTLLAFLSACAFQDSGPGAPMPVTVENASYVPPSENYTEAWNLHLHGGRVLSVTPRTHRIAQALLSRAGGQPVLLCLAGERDQRPCPAAHVETVTQLTQDALITREGHRLPLSEPMRRAAERYLQGQGQLGPDGHLTRPSGVCVAQSPTGPVWVRVSDCAALQQASRRDAQLHLTPDQP